MVVNFLLIIVTAKKLIHCCCQLFNALFLRQKTCVNLMIKTPQQ